MMAHFTFRQCAAMTMAITLSGVLAPSARAQAQASLIETQALRCSALTFIHSTLTVPSPQFGEVMTEVASLFAQIHASHYAMRTKSKLTMADLRRGRDGMVAELNKGWPANKARVIKEAAICNMWRSSLFATLPDTATDKHIQAAIDGIGNPPKEPVKAETDKWTMLTPMAFDMWAQVKVAPAKKK